MKRFFLAAIAVVAGLAIQPFAANGWAATMPVTTTAAGSTRAGSDYAATRGTLIFCERPVQTITVSVIGDRAFEFHESCLVTLFNASGKNARNPQGFESVGTLTVSQHSQDE